MVAFDHGVRHRRPEANEPATRTVAVRFETRRAALLDPVADYVNVPVLALQGYPAAHAVWNHVPRRRDAQGDSRPVGIRNVRCDAAGLTCPRAVDYRYPMIDVVLIRNRPAIHVGSESA